MQKEDVVLLAQLVHAMKDVAREMEKAYEKKDSERLEKAKAELLKLQKEVDRLT